MGFYCLKPFLCQGIWKMEKLILKYIYIYILGEEHGFHNPVNLSMTIDHLTPLLNLVKKSHFKLQSHLLSQNFQ